MMPPVDTLLTKPPRVVGGAFTQLTEDQWFDRKSGRVKAKDLAVALVAFSNAEGGWIVVGIHDGEVDGVSAERSNELRQASIDHTSPPVRVHVEEIPAELSSGEDGILLAFRVAPGEVVHEMKNGDCYLRVGDESRKLSFAQRQELHYDRGHAPYDGTLVPGVDVEHIADAEQARAYAETLGASSVERMLEARSLVTSTGVTVAAYLLFDEHPQKTMPHACVRVLRYDDLERGSGSRQALADEAEVRVEGPLPALVHDAAESIERLIPKRRVLAASGRFEPMPIIPRDAWLEGLVNAVIHRSYSAAGDHIRVEIFPDRIEVESPGRFPGIADTSDPRRIPRYSRNPRIARVCTDLRISQELGEGISRIFDEMRMRGLTDPVYEQTPGSVRLTLSAADAIPEQVLARLPRGARGTLDALRRARRPLGTGEVTELTRLSRPTVMKHLAALRKAGLVTWDGNSARDPRATWTVT